MKVKRLFTAKQIAKRIEALGKQIRKDAGDHEVFLLGILKGASIFLADLMRNIEGAVAYSFIDVVRDMADNEIAAALEIDFLSYTDISGRNVYLLKDVVSTGVIETYLLSQLRLERPASLKLVALLDRPELRTVDLKADYAAFKVGEGSFAGYGLEADGRFGNLPYIGRVK
ncbi:MAG TPA: phosphoribosyltransferase family protein [Thermoanaerobaculia bacterium]|nr:phosphoribosyltransferase family protein [Thermoanaerobaculia bacterium]